jgi:thioredoxin reductase
VFLLPSSGTMMATTVYDAAIIGGGPAGLSAALVLGRCLRRVVVFDSGHYRNDRSRALHCYLGHDGIAPRELLGLSRAQLRRYDTVEWKHGLASAIKRNGEAFVISSESAALQARTVLVATGVVDELPPIAGIDAYFGRSVHVCPYCDGWEYRHAPVAAFGRGDKGASLARLLHHWTSDLVLCTHGPSGLSHGERDQLARRGISLRENRIAGLRGRDGYLEALVFENGDVLSRNALFFNTGQHPRSALLESLGCVYGEEGVACDPEGATSVQGVYVAGDASREVQLVVIAAAEGARAGLAINKALLAAAARDRTERVRP